MPEDQFKVSDTKKRHSYLILTFLNYNKYLINNLNSIYVMFNDINNCVGV